ncbi:hypothetical protein O7635_29470 [Asanoa sp. WMMD1127]|uniref:hypothetical protein n=1 Tax=Asanoa sp. WMMD1127 TaxID=3016107 RepID=UPI0024168ADE|nr:hypothetical protein [Asanoa sp. WMMD1127]MDG4825999.1 hypothetical protein [Asanoa sp. WMMD1127]
MDYDLRRALEAIERCDPDGGEIEPTETAYAVHKAWAIDRYGEAVWKTYVRGGWGDYGLDIV